MSWPWGRQTVVTGSSTFDEFKISYQDSPHLLYASAAMVLQITLPCWRVQPCKGCSQRQTSRVFQSFVPMRLQFSLIFNQSMRAESRSRYVHPMFQLSVAHPCLAAVCCMRPNRCFMWWRKRTPLKAMKQ